MAASVHPDLQLARAERAYLRLRDAHEDNAAPRAIDDRARAFFQECFIVRDWLKGCGQFGREPDVLFRTDALSLCAEFANRCKHPADAHGHEVGLRHRLGPKGAEVVLYRGTDEHPIMPLATRCIQDVRAFFEANGLGATKYRLDPETGDFVFVDRGVRGTTD